MSEPERLRTFADFYPFYLGEHRNPIPLFSFMGDWRRWWDVLQRRQRLSG